MFIMKNKSILKSIGGVIFSLLLLGSLEAQTEFLNINYGPGGFCNNCGSIDYSCGGFANWNNGMRDFTDPIPAGNIVTSVDLEVFAGCMGGQVDVTINGQPIGTYDSNGNTCSCGTCSSNVLNLSVPNGLVNYQYGAINTLQLTPDGAGPDGGICVDRVEITLGYTAGTAVPTMGEWGLIILALLVLSFGTVFMMRRRASLAGAGNVSMSQSGGIPFDRASFGKMLAVVMIGFVAIVAISVLVFGYEMTNADVPGSLIAGPIAAYLLHLLFGAKK